MRYFDSGVLLKLYLREPNSELAISFIRESGAGLPLTALHRLEMKAAVAAKVGRGEITALQSQAIWSIWEDDIAAGVLIEINLPWPSVFSRAESLARDHAATHLCRSLDILHISSALEMGATELCTFDRRQALMAQACGLPVLPKAAG